MDETKVINEKPKKKKRIKKWKIIVGIVAVVILLGIGTITVIGGAMDSSSEEYYSVVIPNGAGSSSIAVILEEEGIIDSQFNFKVYAKLKGAETSMQAGTYNLSPSMSIGVIIDTLVSGDIETIPVTITEGMTVLQIAEVIEESGITTKEDFLDAEKNGEYNYTFMEYIPEDNEYRLEGFLYPDTYYFAEDTSGEVIINAMLASFDKNFTDEYYERAEEMGYTVLEIITMASIIEKEAALEDDRALVASVFYNRLDLGMELGSDPTVNYITDKIGEEPTASDLLIDSPYNTRLNTGLPPGPICSPGIKSIEAALYPEESDYIFFVVKDANSLELVFTTNLEDHNEAVEVYYNSVEE